ncbi:hypothetical protein [Streptomyces sp. NBRC 109706]|uniref:hypothetical protein n=1 Tax=Streptomyces sp. NBRC 109706 TaxID=1550035 RepID=UPI0007811D8F|nr:hypothetical protein [Streptomyces sp. NBRC 109706]
MTNTPANAAAAAQLATAVRKAVTAYETATGTTPSTLTTSLARRYRAAHTADERRQLADDVAGLQLDEIADIVVAARAVELALPRIISAAVDTGTPVSEITRALGYRDPKGVYRLLQRDDAPRRTQDVPR